MIYSYKGRSFLIKPYRDEEGDCFVWEEVGSDETAWAPHPSIESCIDEIVSAVDGITEEDILEALAAIKAELGEGQPRH